MGDGVISLRNGPAGYGIVTKSLHWLTVLVLATQLLVGYSMTRSDDLLEAPIDRWLDGDEERLIVVHAGLGVCILVLATIRLLWRILTPLPPWAEGLSHGERRLEHRTEQVLYLSLFLIPVTGMALLFGSGEDWDISKRGEWESPWEFADDDVLLVGHIASHLLFYAALALHVGLVLKHTVIKRDGQLWRML